MDSVCEESGTEKSKQERRGIVIVHTGDGKGKTTAALGMVFRAIGREISCGVVQFIKGKWETGEKKFAAQLPQLEFFVMGLGFTWESDDLDRDRAAARKAWEKAVEMISSGERKIVVLDEITYAFHFGWLSVEEVLDVFRARPRDVHIVITGRRCPEAILEYADLVSVIENRKHPFQQGIPAQIGIDF